MSGALNDEELARLEAAAEVPFDKLDASWLPVLTRPDLRVVKQPIADTALFRYYAKGSFEGLSAATLYESSIDDEYRQKWDKYCIEIRTLDQSENQRTLYWSCKFPFPMTNRDYVVYRRLREDRPRGRFVIASRGGTHAAAPEKKNFIRVERSQSVVVFQTSADGRSTDYSILYEDDLKGSIPTAIMNWAISKGVPDFIAKTRRACVNYAAWREKHVVQSPKTPALARVVAGDGATASTATAASKAAAVGGGGGGDDGDDKGDDDAPLMVVDEQGKVIEG